MNLSFDKLFLHLQHKQYNEFHVYLIMKRIVSILAVFIACVALHAEERPITFGELPKEAKIFVLTYFKNAPITQVCMERRASLTQYEVTLQNGLKMQFDRTGVCTELSNKKDRVPDIVIPKKILNIVKANFPDSYIQKLEHNDRMYEVDLSNNITLTFNNSFRLVDVEK